MFRTIDNRHIRNGSIDVSGFDSEETIILGEDLGRVIFRGPLRVRNLIVHTGVSIVFEEMAIMGRNVLGSCVFMNGLEARNVNAVGDVLVRGDVSLGEDRSNIERGRLLIRGGLSSRGDVVVPDGCCRVTGPVTGPGALVCDDVWAPSLGSESGSDEQLTARRDMDDVLGKGGRAGLLRMILGS